MAEHRQAASSANTVYDYEGQNVIVSGAARGIGLEVSRAFASMGARVWMVDVDREQLETAAEEVGGGWPVAADNSKTEDVDRVVTDVVSAGGRIDVIFNNAGILRDNVLWKLTDEDWDLVVDISLGGTFRPTRACVPYFRERNYGRVINVTSYTGLHGNVGQAAYAAAKAGVIGFTKTAAKELGRFGITVNAISPNAKTRMVETIPAEHLRELEAQIPLGHFGNPSEIAEAVLFLGSPGAKYITGAILPVDGGLSI